MKKTRQTKGILLMLLTMLVLTLAGCGKSEDEGSKLTSMELVKDMGNGINLGNTMEAYGRATLGTTAEVSAYETYWGQPVTTKEMIDAMKAAGFDSIRIPVAWTNAMNFETGDYTIGEAYLNRVGELIDYALDADMYVVVNDHWDGGWWGMFGSATEETRTQAMELYTSMWEQIANKYKNRSDKLIFESGNEELGNRLNDTDIAADSGTLDMDECFAVTNQINQAFVDTIRATGGKNANRFLLIAGYGTDIQFTTDDRFVMPTDTATDKLLISVHFYEPFGYCGSTSLSSWGTPKNYNDQNYLLELMTKFSEQGIGVVIGEYAVALNEDGSVKDNTVDFLTNFLDNCDLYGYAPMLWDCSSLFIRTDLAFKDADVASLYLGRSRDAQAEMTEEEIQAAAQQSMDASLAAAEEKAAAAGTSTGAADDQAIAWLMYNSSDWSTLYSAGDTYDPNTITEGTVPTDVEITGEGTYTVGLDFTGTAAGYANSVVFSAVGISNGEQLYPGYVIEIQEILVNGEPYTMIGTPYTASDDGKCTRTNLYNSWVTTLPDDIRVTDAAATDVTPCVLDAETLGNVETISVTFNYVPAQ